MPLDLFYTMVQKSQKWPKTQIKGGGSCLKCTVIRHFYSEFDLQRQERKIWENFLQKAINKREWKTKLSDVVTMQRKRTGGKLTLVIPKKILTRRVSLQGNSSRLHSKRWLQKQHTVHRLGHRETYNNDILKRCTVCYF